MTEQDLERGICAEICHKTNQKDLNLGMMNEKFMKK